MRVDYLFLRVIYSFISLQSELFGSENGVVGAPKHQVVCKPSVDNIKGIVFTYWPLA